MAMHHTCKWGSVCCGFQIVVWRIVIRARESGSRSASHSYLLVHTCSHLQEYFTRIMKKLKEVRNAEHAKESGNRVYRRGGGYVCLVLSVFILE